VYLDGIKDITNRNVCARHKNHFFEKKTLNFCSSTGFRKNVSYPYKIKHENLQGFSDTTPRKPGVGVGLV
jgi:hypothetical protein